MTPRRRGKPPVASRGGVGATSAVIAGAGAKMVVMGAAPATASGRPDPGQCGRRAVQALLAHDHRPPRPAGAPSPALYQLSHRAAVPCRHRGRELSALARRARSGGTGLPLSPRPLLPPALLVLRLQHPCRLALPAC